MNFVHLLNDKLFELMGAEAFYLQAHETFGTLTKHSSTLSNLLSTLKALGSDRGILMAARLVTCLAYQSRLLFFFFLLLIPPSSRGQGTNFSITLLDHQRQVTGSTVVFRYIFTADNLAECATACDFRASLHHSDGSSLCQTDGLIDDVGLELLPLVVSSTGVEAQVVFDVTQASDAFLQNAIVNNTLQFCLRLDNYDDDSGSPMDYTQTVSRTGVSLYGNFTTGQDGITLAPDASSINDFGAESDAFTVPIVAGSCPGTDIVQVADDGSVFMQVCIGSSQEFWSVQSVSQASVERSTTGATQIVVADGIIQEPSTTTVTCDSIVCSLRFRLDPAALGTGGGTIRFYGSAILAISDGERRRTLLQVDTHTTLVEEFEYNTQLEEPLEDSSSADSVCYSTATSSIILFVVVSSLTILFG